MAVAEMLDGTDERLIPACIEVAHHVERGRMDAMRTALAVWFKQEEHDEDEPFRYFGDAEEKWLEKTSEDRRAAFSSAKGDDYWTQVDDSFLEAVTSMGARVHELEHLPVAIVVVRFDIKTWAGGEHDNTVKQLRFYMDLCRTLVQNLLGESVEGLGQVVGATSETRRRDDLNQLRREVRLVRDAQRDGRDPPLNELTSPDLQAMPPGRGGGGHGFSHYLVAANIHAKVVPTQGVGLHGNEWIIALYEWGEPDEDPSHAPLALTMVNPTLYSRPTDGFKERATGLLALQVFWHWLRFQVPRLRRIETAIQEQGRRLRRWPFGLLNGPAWRRLQALESEARDLLYGLRTVHEEYRFGIEEFLRIQRGKTSHEVPIPPGGLEDPLETSHPGEGVLTQFVAGYQRDLDHALNEAERVWESAQAEKADFAVRVQMAVAVAILVLTLVLLGIAVADYQLTKQSLQVGNVTAQASSWLFGLLAPSAGKRGLRGHVST